MPTYDYACDACAHEFERVQRITENAIKKCPDCGKMKARRMIGGGSFILKGGNWESDLYSGASNRKGASSSEKSPGAAKKSESPAKKSAGPAKKSASRATDAG